MFWATEVLFCSVCLWPPVIYCVMWLWLCSKKFDSFSECYKENKEFFLHIEKLLLCFDVASSVQEQIVWSNYFFLVKFEKSSFTVLKPNTGKSVSYWIKCAENMWKFYSCSKSGSQGFEGEANIHLIHLIFWRCV